MDSVWGSNTGAIQLHRPTEISLLQRNIPKSFPSTWPQNVQDRAVHIRQIKALLVTSKAIWKATQRDPTLSQVKTYILQGWPGNSPKEVATSVPQ